MLLTVARAPEDKLPADIEDMLEEADMEGMRVADAAENTDHWDGFCATLAVLAGEVPGQRS